GRAVPEGHSSTDHCRWHCRVLSDCSRQLHCCLGGNPNWSRDRSGARRRTKLASETSTENRSNRTRVSNEEQGFIRSARPAEGPPPQKIPELTCPWIQDFGHSGSESEWLQQPRLLHLCQGLALGLPPEYVRTRVSAAITFSPDQSAGCGPLSPKKRT